MIDEELDDIICSAVQGQLGEWGTTAKVTEYDGMINVSLRIVLNHQIKPLIKELREEIGAYLERKKV